MVEFSRGEAMSDLGQHLEQIEPVILGLLPKREHALIGRYFDKARRLSRESEGVLVEILERTGMHTPQHMPDSYFYTIRSPVEIPLESHRLTRIDEGEGWAR